MLHCFWEMKCQQGFTTEIWYYVCYGLGWSHRTSISGVVVSKWEFQSNAQESLHGRGEYEFALHFWYFQPLVKNRWGEAEDLILLFF